MNMQRYRLLGYESRRQSGYAYVWVRGGVRGEWRVTNTPHSPQSLCTSVFQAIRMKGEGSFTKWLLKTTWFRALHVTEVWEQNKGAWPCNQAPVNTRMVVHQRCNPYYSASSNVQFEGIPLIPLGHDPTPLALIKVPEEDTPMSQLCEYESLGLVARHFTRDILLQYSNMFL